MCHHPTRPRTSRSRESYRKDIEVRVKSKEWLRAVMANRGMGTRQVADKAGLSYQAVNFLVSERPSGRSSCSLDTAVRIAGALEWDLQDLFVPKTSTARNAAPSAPQSAAA